MSSVGTTSLERAVIPPGTEVFDAHAHVDDSPLLGWHDPPEKLIRLMDEAGISKAIVMTYSDAPAVNDRALDNLSRAIDPYRARLYPFARIHPGYGNQAIRMLRRAFRELGVKGLKLHPVGTLSHPADDWSVQLMRVAEEFNAPVLFHCGDEPMTTPLAIAAAAQRLPSVSIILGHMGGYFHVDEAIRVADAHSNIYLETSAMPYPTKIAEAVARIGPERILFASDGPGCNPRLELLKVLMANVSSTHLPLVLGSNIARLVNGVGA